MTTTPRQITVQPYTRTEVTYEWRKFLGIFSYRVEVCATDLFNTLYIESDNEFKDIILNGKKIDV
jgi:hypothetical protein